MIKTILTYTVLLMLLGCSTEYSGYPVIEFEVAISGEIECPGIFLVDSTYSVAELINQACGMTPYADTDFVKPDYILKPNDQIFIPRLSNTTMQSCIDLNQASYDELIKLPGVGDAYANRILAYRASIGSFHDNSQLMEISGIKEKRYEKIEPLLC